MMIKNGKIHVQSNESLLYVLFFSITKRSLFFQSSYPKVLNMNLTNRLIIVTILCFFASDLYGKDFNLPDLGSPSDVVLSKIQEAEIRKSIVNQIYQYDLVMLDPIIADYMEQLGYRLAAHSENPESPFDFFLVNQNVINASAYPGGLIIIFSGLFLRSETESELAGVMAHEIAHATQRHISRSYANAKKSTIPMILGLVGAAVAARSSSSGDAPIAIATAATALQRQSQINYTRSNEYEADRVGIETLNTAGFNPLGMSGFFEKLMREKPLDQRFQPTEYMRTHPLSINRVTEAKNRAQKMNSSSYKESALYPYVKERIRVLTKDLKLDNITYYKKLFNDKLPEDITGAETYGYALSLYYAGQFRRALNLLNTIEITDEIALMINVLKANIISGINLKQGREAFSKLYAFYPDSPMVIVPYIQMLIRTKNYENNKEARNLARKLVQLYPEKPNYYRILAVINQNMGKSIEANEALATREHHMNNNYSAVRILKNILKEDLDYYQRARIEARIIAYENLISEREIRQQRQLERTQRTRTGG